MKSKSEENNNNKKLNFSNLHLFYLSYPNKEEKSDKKYNLTFDKEDNVLFENNKNKFNVINDYYQIQNKIKTIEINNKSFNQNYSIIQNDIKYICETIYKLNNNTLNILSEKKIELNQIKEIKNYSIEINFKITELIQKISSLINSFNEKINLNNELISYIKILTNNFKIEKTVKNILKEYEKIINYLKEKNINNIKLKEKGNELIKKYSSRCETAELLINIEKEVIKDFSKFEVLNKEKENVDIFINDKIKKCENENLKIENELNLKIEKRQKLNLKIINLIKAFTNYIQYFNEKNILIYQNLINQIKDKKIQNDSLIKEIEINIEILNKRIFEFLGLEIYFEENIIKCKERIISIDDNFDPRCDELNKLIFQYEKIKQIIIEYLNKYKNVFLELIVLRETIFINIFNTENEYFKSDTKQIYNIEISNISLYQNKLIELLNHKDNIENNISKLKIKYIILSILPNQFLIIRPILINNYLLNQNNFLQNKIKIILGNNFNINKLYYIKKISK